MKAKSIKPGGVLKIPDETILEKPITAKTKKILVGKNCSLTIIETIEKPSQPAAAEIILGEGSSLRFVSVQNLPESAPAMKRKATLARDASLDWSVIDLGGGSTMDAVLQGAGSSLKTSHLAIGSVSQHFDVSLTSTHSAPGTRSTILQKAAMAGKAKIKLNGLVKIQKKATNSNGFQQEDILLLSPEAEASPTPNLEIENNDVRCTHASTVSHMDKERLFYPMSRGLTEEQAARLLVKGFFEPIIKELPLKDIQDKVRAAIEEKLEVIA